MLAALISPALLANAAQGQTVTTLYNFTNQNGSGSPQAVALVQGRDAELYGASFGSPYGSVFKVSTSRIFSDFFAFSSTNGCCPKEGLTLASDGNFYGAAFGGGNGQNGVFFKITPSGTYTAIHYFAGGSDGANPFAAPMQASDGNLYGTTYNTTGTGSTVYKYTPSSGTFSTIYEFSDGTVSAPLMQATDGFLYGTTLNGGWAHCGTIFKISTAGLLLQSVPFLCNAGGSTPGGGPLVQTLDGNFYGITTIGGFQNQGTVFKMTPDFHVTILYTFMGRSGGLQDGRLPAASLFQATDGNLYGTTYGGGAYGAGTLFQISTKGAYKLLYSFNGATGGHPQGNLMQHTNGALYGTAQVGGTGHAGTVYELNLGLGPFIAFVRPSGAVGQTVQILGQQLTGATSVTFNGIPAASFTVTSPTFLLATVPSGATSGPVVVTTPTATLNSNVNFNVVP